MKKKHSRNWGGARPNSGPKTSQPGTERHFHSVTSFKKTDSPEKLAIVSTLDAVATAPLKKWYAAIIAQPGVESLEVELRVYGRWGKVREIQPGEVSVEEIETELHNIRPGEYRFKVIHDGDYVGNPTRGFMVGGEEAVARSEVTQRGFQATVEDADAVLAQSAKRVSVAQAIRIIEGGEQDDMKPEQLLTLANALKPDMGPIMTMMADNARQAEQRAEREAQRNHELQMKMIEAQSKPAAESSVTIGTVIGPVLEFLKPLASPALLQRILGRFISEPAPVGGWTPEGIVGALGGLLNSPILQGLMPLITPLIEKAMSAAQAPQATIVTPAPAPPAALPTPAPNGGPPAMPNEVMNAIVTELRKPQDDRDFAGLVAFLDSIPIAPGVSLMSIFENLAAMNESLCRVAVNQYDARFVDAETWPGLVAFLGYLRKMQDEAEAEAKTEGTGE